MLLLLHAVAAVVAAASQPARATPLRFAGGKDVFGREPICRACHDFIRNAEPTLLKKLGEIAETQAKLSSSSAHYRTEFGKYEGLIQDYVYDGACLHNTVFHDRDTHKACEKFVEEHEDHIIATVYRYTQQAKGAAFHWNEQLCSSVCPKHLASRQLSDFENDGSAEEEERYRSEPPPRKPIFEGSVQRAVAQNFETIVASFEGDVIAYLSYPDSHRDFHEAAMPTFDDAANIFASNATVPIRFVRIDLDMNDLPPPHGTSDRLPKLVLYARNRRTFPVYMTNVPDGKVTLYDFCLMILHGDTQMATREFVVALMKEVESGEVEYDVMYKNRDMYDESRVPSKYAIKKKKKKSSVEEESEEEEEMLSPKLKYDL
ncbi:hypothetical protein PPROV_001086800 [Pycnococcus provasolii]|uniref:Cytochrome c domain-containing protein n=2 Tax=Pycnococcus provasolii TaxID=41880 RepID=A0A830I320_9CHLO|nr:hypothetical protein PPROV_001086800 [Pycnococcus provasolii]